MRHHPSVTGTGVRRLPCHYRVRYFGSSSTCSCCCCCCFCCCSRSCGRPGKQPAARVAAREEWSSRPISRLDQVKALITLKLKLREEEHICSKELDLLQVNTRLTVIAIGHRRSAKVAVPSQGGLQGWINTNTRDGEMFVSTVAVVLENATKNFQAGRGAMELAAGSSALVFVFEGKPEGQQFSPLYLEEPLRATAACNAGDFFLYLGGGSINGLGAPKRKLTASAPAAPGGPGRSVHRPPTCATGAECGPIAWGAGGR